MAERRSSMAAPFEEKPIHYWDDADVAQWLRAGHLGAGGWAKRLSRDYGPLFLVCGVTGDALLDMQCFEREDWKAMADELEEEHLAAGQCAVKLADRAKIIHDIVRRAAAMSPHSPQHNLAWSPGQLGGLKPIATITSPSPPPMLMATPSPRHQQQ